MDTTPEKNQPRILETVNKQIDLHHDEHSANLKGEDSAHKVSVQLQKEGRRDLPTEGRHKKTSSSIQQQMGSHSKPNKSF